MSRSSVDAAFDLLDTWRHLPSYQLERRADIFFAVYLPSFLSDHLRFAINPLLIPEFPIKVAPEIGKPGTNRSKKIDYVGISADRSRVLFIELKTDCGSRNTIQNNYLIAAQKTGLNMLLQDLKQIAAASSAVRKYAHLFRELASLGLVQLPIGFVERLSENGTSGIADMIASTRVVASICSIEIYFFQPRLRAEDEAHKNYILTFDAFAAWLSKRNDPFAVRFAESVKRWSFDAGSCDERDSTEGISQSAIDEKWAKEVESRLCAFNKGLTSAKKISRTTESDRTS